MGDRKGAIATLFAYRLSPKEDGDERWEIDPAVLPACSEGRGGDGRGNQRRRWAIGDRKGAIATLVAYRLSPKEDGDER